MADQVAAKAGERLEIQVFPNQQLGNERDMIEGMQLGTIDLAVINTPLLAGSHFQLFDMPFLFNSWEHVKKTSHEPDRRRSKKIPRPKAAEGVRVLDRGIPPRSELQAPDT